MKRNAQKELQRALPNVQLVKSFVANAATPAGFNLQKEQLSNGRLLFTTLFIERELFADISNDIPNLALSALKVSGGHANAGCDFFHFLLTQATGGHSS